VEDIHSIVVTVAIPVLAAGIVADFINLVADNEKLQTWTSRLLLIGAALVALAAFSGSSAYDGASEEIREFAAGHRTSAFVLLWSLIGLIAMRFLFFEFNLFQSLMKWSYYALLVALAVLLFRTANMGNRVGDTFEKKLPPVEERQDKRDLFQ